jgi:hypothetical protein
VYLVYQPEGSEEPKRWPYNPRKLMSAEREVIERRCEMVFADFTKAVIQGSSLARRALLWVFLKRDHPTMKWDDVDFAWDELRLEYSRQEFDQMIEDARNSETLSGDQREAVLTSLRAERETAFEDPEHEGKASRPVVD